jgi:two-component system cell cycle response regulator
MTVAMTTRPTDRGAARPRPRAARVTAAALPLALALLTATWAHVAVGFGGPAVADVFSRWVYDVVMLLAVVALVGGAAPSRPAARMSCAVLAGGLFAHLAGDVVYSMAPDLSAVPVPSVSDPLWLAIYPCLYTAVAGLGRRHAGHVLLAARLDGLVAGLAMAALLACFSLPLALEATAGAPFWESATNLAYPIGDLVLLGAVVSAVAMAGWRVDATWALIGAGTVAWEAADLLYLRGVNGTLGDIADALVLTGVMGIAAAGCVAASARGERLVDPGHALLVPVGFALVALGVLAAGAFTAVNMVGLALAVVAVALGLLRMALALRENQALLGTSRVEATTDPLTGLGNRRRLIGDLGRVLGDGDAGEPHALVLLDLNGFKAYNDLFGHGAGDVLLAQLGAALADAVASHGTAYRMGGDEFCVLAPCEPARVEELSARCAAALSARGDGFAISAAHGAVAVPAEERDAVAALRTADARMYRDKNGGRVPVAGQSAGVLVAVVEERAPELADRMRRAEALAGAVADELGMEPDDLEVLRFAARLHDVGRMAVPESILAKAGELTAAEWELVRRHPLIGERILAAAPALERSARIVRSTHERIDGRGYPDGLRGEAIPLAARIVAAADAFVAMTSERPHAAARPAGTALEELHRCAGSQFDPDVVAALERALARPLERPAAERRGAA